MSEAPTMPLRDASWFRCFGCAPDNPRGLRLVPVPVAGGGGVECHFYSRLVEHSLRASGERALEGVRSVLSTFRMPLDGSLDGYWRMGLAAVDAVGHDHTEAYDAIGKLVRRFVDQLGAPAVEDLGQLICSAQRMP